MKIINRVTAEVIDELYKYNFTKREIAFTNNYNFTPTNKVKVTDIGNLLIETPVSLEEASHTNISTYPINYKDIKVRIITIYLGSTTCAICSFDEAIFIGNSYIELGREVYERKVESI